MVVNQTTSRFLALSVRGKMGFTGAVGMARAGYSKAGASKQFGGIYQRKKTKKGWRTSRMRYYNPSNPQTETQQAWRAVLASGWEAYALLTTDEKVLLSKQARLRRMTGPNLFMSRWLQSHR